MASNRIIEFIGFKLCINENVYEPAEDSELLASILDINEGEIVVDLGSGSGILGLVAKRMGGKVISVDVNPFATEATLCSAKVNSIDIDVINCNVLDCLRVISIDALIFNPPYLPVDERSSWIGYSWSGGIGGVEVLSKALREIKARKYYFVYSSFSDEEIIYELLNEEGLEIDKVKEMVIGFETLKAVKVVVKSNPSRA
ncbi:HemK2/MTQ2 family protein methyltransferase [Metallosphaera hakonensis]|uniref:Methyltransferase n=1 Tax=Metallosphaera hakonensis JCM 8857 = DSM 7519 TaxID=1293036 RepID=A0A2U9ITS9_9CREN|nr:HemK2/MTQ2 family protein methyltransferase [Metallosphaera hakonensis]AWR99434.1 methyltransferase [Metallosphaera hakonensis JCM 8857 = DSM 7519]